MKKKSEPSLTHFALDIQTGDVILMKDEKPVYLYKSEEGERIARRINRLFEKAFETYEEYKTYN